MRELLGHARSDRGSAGGREGGREGRSGGREAGGRVVSRSQTATGTSPTEDVSM